MRLSFLGKWHSCCFSSFCSLMCCSPGSRLSLGSWSSVARSSWCSSWWRLKSSTRNWDFMLMGCSGSGTSCLSKLDLKLGSKFAVKGRGGQGGLTTSCPDTTEGVVELVQLPAVGVEHLEVASLVPHYCLTSHFLARISLSPTDTKWQGVGLLPDPRWGRWCCGRKWEAKI